MKIYLAICCMLMGCSQELLEPGAYPVTVQYTRDDWPQSRLGEISKAIWHIGATSPIDWALHVDGSTGKPIPGREQQAHLVFTRGDDLYSFNVNLDPDTDGHGFFARGVVIVTLCNNNDCVTLYTTADIRSY